MKIYALERQDGSDQLTFTLLRTLKPHATPVTALTIDGTGTLIVTGGADAVIKIWDLRGGYTTHIFRGHAGVISALHFFEVPENVIQVNERPTRRERSRNKSLDDGDDANSSYRLASGSEDGKIRIWHLTKGKSIATLDSHVSVVRGLDFSSMSKVLVSASRDKTVIVWDVETWKLVRIIPVLESIEAVKIICNGAFLIIGGEHGSLRLWNTRSGSEVTSEQDPKAESDAILQILYNEEQDLIISVHADQSLLFYSSTFLHNSNTATSPLESLPVSRRITGTHDEIIDLAYVNPDRSLLALATNSESIRLVSLNTVDTASSESPVYFGADVALLQGHEDIIICVAVDWSGHWLATGAKDNTARLWRIDQVSNLYELYASFSGHAESIGAIALPSVSPQADSAEHKSPLDHPPPFLLTGSQDRTIKRWTIPRGSGAPARALYTRKAHDKDINALAHSPSSQLFASASQDRTVKIWSTEEGEIQGVLRGHKRGVWSVAFAPKDTPPITSEDGSTAATNRGMILTGSGDKTVKIWSLNDYSCLRTFEGHTNSVLKVLWLPPSSINSNMSNTSHAQQQSREVVSAGGDGLIKIWSPTSNDCLATLDNHTDRVWALTVNPTDRTLISGGGDSVVTFWKDTSTQTAAAKDQAATERVEQDQQLSNYVYQGQYREAIVLAIALNHPARLLSLFTSVVNTQPPEADSITGVKAVDEVLGTLSDTQLLSLLQRLRDWNTNARTCAVAQRILNVIVKAYPAQRLTGLGKKRGGKEVVEALKVYTERHFKRVEELWGESWLVEYLLGEMGGLIGDSEKASNGVDGIAKGSDVVMVE